MRTSAVLIGLSLVLRSGAAREEKQRPGDALYCGSENCYEVLGVDRSATRSAVKNAYRKLAGRLHPDRQRTNDDRTAAAFMRVVTAYEVLNNRESREDYDYMLDHPEEQMYNYYRYYRHKAVPKWVVWRSGRERVYESALYDEMWRAKARKVALEEGLLRGPDKGEEENGVLLQVLKRKLSPTSSSRNWRHTLLGRLVMIPVTLPRYIMWRWDWHQRINVRKEPLREEDQIYLACKALGKSPEEWEVIDEHEREEMLKRKIWIPKRMKRYSEEKEAAAMQALKAKFPGRYKMWKRQQKRYA